MKNIPIGEVLKDYSYIDGEQLQRAFAEQKRDCSKWLEQHLTDLDFTSKSQMPRAPSDRLNEPTVDLNEEEAEVDVVAKIPKALAQKYNLIAISENNGRLAVVTSNPLNFYGIENVRLMTGMSTSVCLCEKAAIDRATNYYYVEIKAREAANVANENVVPFGFDDAELYNSGEDDTPVVKLFNSLLMRGYNVNASGIHIEPFEDETMVRMHIDDMIMDYTQPTKNLHQSLIVRIKIVGDMDTAEKRAPQDGHFLTTIGRIRMNLRVSVIPTVYGEKTVLRFLNSNTPILNEEQYGTNTDNYAKIRHMMEMPHGVIHITGPIGSGKTTTLYMTLETLAKRQVNIATTEDPAEEDTKYVNQVQVNTMAGLTFECGPRVLLRQNPNIILVGEIRDAKMASIFVRATIIGHLVLSPLHTDDAISSTVRLEDMGAEPYPITNSLVGSASQRLVRTIYPHYRKKLKAIQLERQVLGKGTGYVYRGAGCHHRNQAGCRGKTAMHEIILIDRETQRMISSHRDTDDIYAYVKKPQQLHILKDKAVELIISGQTTMDRLYKIAAYSG